MKYATIFLCALALSFEVKAQSILDPGTYPEATWSNSQLSTEHGYVDNVHAYNKVSSFNASTYTPNPNEFWQEGTWFSGYLPINNSISTTHEDWYEDTLSNHPLIRTTARYGLGYIHAHHAFSSHQDASEFDARANSAVDYLVEVQEPDGHFIFWKKRPGLTTADSDDSNGGDNGPEAYEQSYAVRLLAEGYWYKKCYLNQDPVDVYDALEKGADYMVDHISEIYPNNGNSNIRGLYCWALAGAYKATGKEVYREKAQLLANALYYTENVDQLGLWQSGVDDKETKPIPASGDFKDINLWISGDFDGDGKDEMLHKFEYSNYIWLQDENLDLGQNNQYPSGTYTLEKWIVGNFDNDPADEIIHKFEGSPYIYLWNEGSSFGTNAIYTGGVHIDKWIAGDFDNDGKDELLQKFSNSNNIYLMDGVYGIGSNAVYSGGATLENWIAGDFDNDGKDEVLQKYTGITTIYQWNHGSGFGSGSIYSGPRHIEKWIVGDFDNDGYEEVLQKYVNSTYIYLWDQGFSFGSNTVYSGGATLDKWVAGDFDGDGRDEVLQKYVSIAKVYQWDYGSSFNGSIPYNGSQHTTEWIVVNRDGGTKKELFQLFDNQNNTFYYWDNLEHCMGCYSIYNIPVYQYHHDSQLQYHGFIMGGLIETYSISSGTEKNNYATSIKRGVNNLIQRTSNTPGSLNKVSNIHYDKNNNLIPLFVREKYLYTTKEGFQQMPQLAYYAQSDGTNFTSTDVSRIINFGNRLAHTNLAGYTYYKDYMIAINNSDYLDYYGGCAEGVFLPPAPPGPIRETSRESNDSYLTINTKDGDFNVFPNPSSNIVNIQSSGRMKGTFEIILLDNLGKTVLTKKFENNQSRDSVVIDVNHLVDGIYILRIKDLSSGEFLLVDKLVMN